MKGKHQLLVEKVGGVATGGGTIDRENLDLGLAQGEKRIISVIRRVKFVVSDSLSGLPFTFFWALRANRRISNSLDPSGNAVDDDALLIGGRFIYIVSTSGATHVQGGDEWELPRDTYLPIVRPCQFAVICSVASTSWGAFVWYTQHKVSTEEITRLLVKCPG